MGRECSATLRRGTQSRELIVAAKAVLHTAMEHGSDAAQASECATPTSSTLEAKRETLLVGEGQSSTEESLEASCSMGWKPSGPALVLPQLEGRTREAREETRMLRQCKESSAETPEVPVTQAKAVLDPALEHGSDAAQPLANTGSSLRDLEVKREAFLVGRKPSNTGTGVPRAVGKGQGSPADARPPQLRQEPRKQTLMISMTQAKAVLHAGMNREPDAEPAATAGSTLSALEEKRESFLMRREPLKPGRPVGQVVEQSQGLQAEAWPPQQLNKQSAKVPFTRTKGVPHTAVECGSDSAQPSARAGSTLIALEVKREALFVGREPALPPWGRPEGLREDASRQQQREGPTKRGSSKHMSGVLITRRREWARESHESTELVPKAVSPTLPKIAEAKQSEDTAPSEGDSLKSTSLVRLCILDQSSVVERKGLSVMTPLMSSLEANKRQDNEDSVELTTTAQPSTGEKDPEPGTEGVAVAKPSALGDERILSRGEPGQNNPRGIPEKMQIPQLPIPRLLGQNMATKCQELSLENPNIPSAGFTVHEAMQLDESGGFAGLPSKDPAPRILARSQGGRVEGNKQSNEFARDVPPSAGASPREAGPRMYRQTSSVAMRAAPATTMHSTPPPTSSALSPPNPTASPVVPNKEVRASEVAIAVAAPPAARVLMDSESSSALSAPSAMPDPASPTPVVPSLVSPTWTKKPTTQWEREPVARVESNEASSLEAPIPAVSAGGPESSSPPQRCPKLPDTIQDVKQEASQLQHSQNCKVLTKRMPCLAILNSPRADLATLRAPLPSDESLTFFSIQTRVPPAASTSSEPIKGLGAVDKPSQAAPAEPTERLYTTKTQKQNPLDGPFSVALPPPDAGTQVSLADVRKEVTILQQEQRSPSPVALPLVVLSTLASQPAPSLGAFPSLQNQPGPESPAVKQEARSVQEIPVSSKLRTNVYVADPPMSSPATSAVLPATEEMSDMPLTQSTSHKGETLTDVLAIRSQERETSREPTYEPLTSTSPTSAPQTQMVPSATVPVPTVPMHPLSRVPTPCLSSPHVSTVFVRTLSVPTVSVATPRVSTPFMSTPLVSTPFVSTASVSTPLVPTLPVSTPSVSAPLVSACCVPKSTVPPTSPQVQTSSMRSQEQAGAMWKSFQASPSNHPPLTQTPSVSTAYVCACCVPGSRQRTPMMMTSSQQTPARWTQQQRRPTVSSPCLAACRVPTRLQQSPAVGTSLQQSAGMSPSVQQIGTPSASRPSNTTTMLTELQQTTQLSTQGQATSAVPLGQPLTRDSSNMADLVTIIQPPLSPPRRCFRCGVTGSRPWRTGPDGSQTLCSSCGLQYEHRNLIVYEDIASGRISAAKFPGSRPVKVIGFHTRGFFSDLSLELAGSLGAYRRPPRDFSRPVVTPLDNQNLGSNDRVVAWTGTYYDVPVNVNGCDGLSVTGDDELRNETGAPPAIQSIEPIAQGYFGLPENIRDEPPPNDSVEVQGSVLSPSCSRGDPPVDGEDGPPTNGQGESPASTPFSRFVRGRRNKPTESDDTRVTEEARDEGVLEQPIDVEAVSADAVDDDAIDVESVHMDAVDVEAVDVDAVDVDANEEVDGQEGDLDSDEIRRGENVGRGENAENVNDPVREDAEITYVLSESEGPRPAVRENRIVAGRKTQLNRQRQFSNPRENDVPLTAITHAVSGDASSAPPLRACVPLVNDNTRQNVTGRPSGNKFFLSLRNTEPRVHEQRGSLVRTDRGTSALGRLLNRVEELPHLLLEQSLEANSACDEFGSVNGPAVRGGSSNSALAIKATEHQGSPCSGVETTRQNAGQKRRRSGVELRENSVRQKLQTFEGSFSEADDSGEDVSPSPRAMQYHGRRRELLSMLNHCPVRTAKPATGTEYVQPRLYSVKAEYRSGLHRLAIPHGMSFADFKTKLQKVFQVTEAIALQYKDNEDDYITVASDSDMEELYVVVQEYSLCPIRIRVCDKF